MKQRLFLFVVFSIIGISCDPSNVTGIVVGGDFLPLTAGNLWEYRVTVVGGSGDTTVPVTVTLSSPVTYDSIAWYGVNDYCVQRSISSPVPMYCAAWGRKRDQILFTQRGPGPARMGYEIVLDLPVWAGKSWFTRPSVDTSYLTAGGDSIVIKNSSRRIVRGLSTVAVPAGVFVDCVEVFDTTTFIDEYYSASDSIDSERSFKATRTTEWFARNVGLVKQIVETIWTPGAPPWRTETRVLLKSNVKGL